MKNKKNTLKSKIIYNDAMEDYVSEQDYLIEEKAKLKTTNKDELIKKIKEYNAKESAKFFKIINLIKKKNYNYEFKGGEPPINSNLLNLVGDEDNLINSYYKIKKNSGAISPETHISEQRKNTMDKEQLEYLASTKGTPDKINIKMIQEVSKLIKQNKYPWGTSTRVHIDKPGKPKVKRPITFPPFMDKIVQNALLEVIQAIYEATFERRNVSFAYRKYKNTRDNIFLLNQNKNAGCFMALEGDIKGAYENTDRKILIKNLSKRIHDIQLLKFIEKRLDYEYKVKTEKEYKTDEQGLPQGGVDSPYLWNIYMIEFDDFITNYSTKLFDKLNKKKRKKSQENITIKTKEKAKNDIKLYVINNVIKWINKTNPKEVINKLKVMYNSVNIKKIKEIPGIKTGLRTIIKEICNIENKNITLKEIKKNLFKEKKKLKDISFHQETADKNKKRLRFAYTRYADDWILITNAKRQIIENIKDKCQKFLKEDLSVTLEPDKTLITNMKKNPAKFLGYEIKVYKSTKTVIKKNKIKTRIRNKIFIEPDKQRMIDKLHMKGYCEKDGFPREIPKLTMLEFYAIIERYNAVIRGIVNAFKNSIKNPKTNLNRWVYIIRYSCLKTLAQKFKTSIRKLYKKYRSKQGKTIETTLTTKIKNKTYKKTWRLLTLKELIQPRRNNMFEYKIKRNFQFNKKRDTI